MFSVSCSPKLFNKFPTAIVLQIANQIEDVLYQKTFRAKRKGLVTIEASGVRYNVIYHKHDDHIEIVDIRQLKKPQKSKSMKKEMKRR